MYSTSPPTPQRPKPLGTSSSAASTPAGGVTHKDMAPQVLKPATTPGPSIPTALAAAAAYCYAKAIGDEHTKMARPVLTALRLLPNLVMLFATRWAPGNRTYARAIWWGFLLCAVGDALVELDGLRFQGRLLLHLLPLGLGLHMAAQAAFAHAFVSDMPASSLQITGAHMWGPALAIFLYRGAEVVSIVPKPITGFSPELLGVVDGKRLRMAVYTASTSLLLFLALARCFAPTTTGTARQAGQGSSKVWAAVGCLFYVTADTLLSYTRYVKPFPFSEGVFLACYFVGQACLAMSIPAWGGVGMGKAAEAEEETKQERRRAPASRTGRATKSRKAE